MRRKSGFTLLELLIVVAVLGIILAISANSMLSLRKSLTLDEATQKVAQDLQACRLLAMKHSAACRLQVLASNRYELRLNRAITNPDVSGGTWQLVKSRDLGRLKLSGLSIGDSVAFDSRGYGRFHLTTPGKIVVSDDSRSRTVVPSMVGTVKVQ